jgi:transposase
LAEDETDLTLLPYLRAGWFRRGEPAKVAISGSNARRTMFGALHLRSGRFLYLEQTRKRAEEFQEFLDYIRWHYRTWPIALILDECSTHKDEASQSLADDLDIQLLWLPKRSPHLNPVEHLWGHAKGAVCTNWQQPSIEGQVYEFIHYLQTHSPTELLRKAAMYSPKFWLSNV